MRAAITLAIMIGSALPAYAGNEAGVIVTGEGAMLPQTLAQIEGWLSHHGRPVIASPLPPDAISEMMNCFVLGHLNCARDIVDARAKSGTVIYVEVDPKRGTRDLALTIYWFDKGRAAIGGRGACERCTNDVLSAVTNDLLTKLAREVAGAAGPVRTERTEVVAVPLTELAIKPRASRGRSRVLSLTTMAAGATAVIAGGILIAIDREPGRHAPAMIYTSAPAGAGISIAGAVVAGVGAYLWFRAPAAGSSPVATVTAGTAYLGWRGRF